MGGRRAGRRRPGANGKRSMASVIKGQIITCIVIVLVIIILKTLNGSLAEQSLETFTSTMARDYTITEVMDSVSVAVKKIGRAPSNIIDSVRNGGKSLNFGPPADGDAVVSVFGQQGRSLKYYFDTGEELQVYAAAGGTVSMLDREQGVLVLSHGNDMQTVYGGITVFYVEELERVKKGQILGSCASEGESALSFELWIDGELADPAEYIDF